MDKSTITKNWIRGASLGLITLLVALTGCEKEIRNIAEPADVVDPNTGTTYSTDVVPFDINVDGFELLEKMQGHWVGENTVIADEYPWFAFDYRAISPSQIHGIFEGGTMGNLLTSFFVTDYKNTRTIMARNGGLLNGIYRTSYFVLDSVNHSSNGDFYRLIDANNGRAIMWMELRFKADSLYFNAYTSKLGEFLPTLHMSFKAKQNDMSMAQTAASSVGFPVNTPAWDFSAGFNESFFYDNPATDLQTASFLAQDPTSDVYTLATASGDPFTISDHPYLGTLQLTATRNAAINGKELFVHLSKDPLTDNNGYLDINAFNSVLLFPQISGTQDDLFITYLHPGNYYVTIIADVNEDGYVSQGDITHITQPITITPEQNATLTIDNITVQN